MVVVSSREFLPNLPKYFGLAIQEAKIRRALEEYE